VSFTIATLFRGVSGIRPRFVIQNASLVMCFGRFKKFRHTVLLIKLELFKIPNRVKGLDAGADDYLIKPFAFEELLARIRVMLRKSSGNITNIYQVGDSTLDTVSCRVQRGKDEIKLTAAWVLGFRWLS
jgi:DNA-binding response OmpR family regulator